MGRCKDAHSEGVAFKSWPVWRNDRAVHHRGELDGSSPESRVSQTGFTASLVVETIYASKSATPQEALNWWLARTEDKNGLLNSSTTLVGISYVKSDANLFGGYFVVVSAKP